MTKGEPKVVKVVKVPELVKVGVPGNTTTTTVAQPPPSFSYTGMWGPPAPPPQPMPAPMPDRNPYQEYLLAMRREQDDALQRQRERLRRLEMDLSLRQTQADFTKQMQELGHMEAALATRAAHAPVPPAAIDPMDFHLALHGNESFFGMLWHYWRLALNQVGIYDVLVLALVLGALWALSTQIGALLYPGPGAAMVKEPSPDRIASTGAGQGRRRMPRKSRRSSDDGVETANARETGPSGGLQQTPGRQARECDSSDVKEVKALCDQLRVFDQR